MDYPYLCLPKDYWMQRYFIDLAYDGTAYHGWQVQPNGVSVQECLERALSTLLRREVGVVGPGVRMRGYMLRSWWPILMPTVRWTKFS